MATTADAVIIGGGHNGLVTAAVLADAGWDVVLLERRDVVGGAVSSVLRDGWVADEFSACYPLAVASPVLTELDLPGVGLRWASAESVVCHPGSPDDTEGALISRHAEDTARRLGDEHPDDERAWLEIVEEYRRIREPLLAAMLTRWPPVASVARLVRRVGVGNLPRLARFLTLPVARMGEEAFRGERGRLLLAGNAMHADIPPDAPGSGLFGWLMAMLAQDVGFPAPVGGASALAQALSDRAQANGARIETGQQVSEVLVGAGRAVGVRTAGGQVIRARRAVIANTSAPELYGRLLSRRALPAGLPAQLDKFCWDPPTVKLNYRLSGGMPWTARQARQAAVVHVGTDVNGLVRWSADLATGRVPQDPFAIVGQMTTIDQTRSPAGTETLWVYSHLPRHGTDDAVAEAVTDGLEDMLERFAPGWRGLVLDRWVQLPSTLAAANPNLGGGAVNGGTAQLFQQAIFRPFLGVGGPRTPIANLYLGSSAAHPGGGVHGACGYLAARAALHDHAWWGKPRAKAELAVLHRLYRENG